MSQSKEAEEQAVNRHLRTQSKLEPPAVPSDGTRPKNGSLPQNNRTKQLSWRSAALAIGIVWFAYYYLGQKFLKPEYQWPVIHGQAAGKGEAAAIMETIPAEANKASAVTSATKWAEVGPALALESGKSAIEVDKAARLSTIQTEQQRLINNLEVAKVASQKAVEIYQACTQNAYTTAGAAESEMPKGVTLSEAQFKSDSLLKNSLDKCNELKSARDAAIANADAAEAALSTNLHQLKGEK